MSNTVPLALSFVCFVLLRPPANGSWWMCWSARYALFETNIKSVMKEKRDVTYTEWSPNQADGL